MYIRSFWAKGYRSLRDVKLEGLGPFNVFYGPNGAGKSNILAGMRALFALLELRLRPEGMLVGAFRQRWPYEDAVTPLLHPAERCNLDRSHQAVLGATLQWDESANQMGLEPVNFSTLTVEVRVDWEMRRMRIARLETDVYNLIDLQPLPTSEDDVRRYEQAQEDDKEDIWSVASGHIATKLGLGEHVAPGYREGLRRRVYWLARHAFTLASADRHPRAEKLSDKSGDVDGLLAQGRLKEALFHAGLGRDWTLRKRFKEFQELLQGPPFHRPPFELIHDAESGLVDLAEPLPDSPHKLAEVPFDLTGLGIAQIYRIIAHLILQRARAVGIEEPEAHLHAPTTGRQLREVLERMVNEHYIDQLFIATHSNLFDLDPNGYFDVSYEPGKGTVVARKDLLEIDKHHLYEPGPAKHALLGFLEYMDKDEIAFRRTDTNEPVTIGAMIEMLQRDDELALDFLRDVHAAAVRAVRVRSKKGTPAT